MPIEVATDDATRAAVGATTGRVICAARDDAGTVVGGTSVRLQPFPGATDRQLWVLDLHGEVDFRAAHAATWGVLNAEFAAGEPEGLLGFPPEADAQLEWPDPRTFLVGYTPQDGEARLAYFDAARTHPDPDWPPAHPSYRTVGFEDDDHLTTQDVIDLWLREGILPEPEARRRADEVLLVAVDNATDELIGISTAYLRHNEQLRLDCWYVRAFVRAAHRRDSVATALAVRTREHLDAAYASGDRRAPAMIFEVENPALKRMFGAAIWNEVGVVFIGENARGDHVRVYYFEGATRS